MHLITTSIAAVALAGASTLMAQGAPQSAPREEARMPFAAAEAKAAIESLAGSLQENFVVPEKGKAYADALRAKLASGGYDSFPSAQAFAEAVTADLQAVFPDRHLRMFPPRADAAGGPRGPRGRGGRTPIEKSGWLADGVAYISFTVFPGDEATVAQVRRFLADHADAKTLIIDAREHRGGGLAEMDVLFPQLFGNETELVQMDTRLAVEQRGEGVFKDGPTLKRLAGPDSVVRRAHVALPAAQPSKLRDAEVILLTSGRTASAAEHLALSLKRTGRATLIGETTRGAGNYGRRIDLSGGYGAFVPLGRTFDPKTNEGWEGRGIEPHIKVPAERALDEALARAGVAKSASELLAGLT